MTIQTSCPVCGESRYWNPTTGCLVCNRKKYHVEKSSHQGPPYYDPEAYTFLCTDCGLTDDCECLVCLDCNEVNDCKCNPPDHDTRRAPSRVEPTLADLNKTVSEARDKIHQAIGESLQLPKTEAFRDKMGEALSILLFARDLIEAVEQDKEIGDVAFDAVCEWFDEQ